MRETPKNQAYVSSAVVLTVQSMQWNSWKGLLKQIAQYPTPPVSESVGIGIGLNFAFLENSQMLLPLLVWEPHFEIHYYNGSSPLKFLHLNINR